jgi:ABC-type sulfate transport system permease subunit
VRHAYWLTAVITLTTVLITGVFGVLTAWVLARHKFFNTGHRLSGLDAGALGIEPSRVGTQGARA